MIRLLHNHAVNGTSLRRFDGRTAKLQQRAGSTLQVISWPGWRLTAKLEGVGPGRQSAMIGSVLLRGPGTAVQVASNKGKLSGEDTLETESSVGKARWLAKPRGFPSSFEAAHHCNASCAARPQ